MPRLCGCPLGNRFAIAVFAFLTWLDQRMEGLQHQYERVIAGRLGIVKVLAIIRYVRRRMGLFPLIGSEFVLKEDQQFGCG